MPRLRRMLQNSNTFHAQQRFVIMLACSIVLSISLGSSMLYESVSFNRDSRIRLAALADIIAADISAALVFDDLGAIDKTLQALKADPTITRLYVLDSRGGVAASYSRKAPDLSPGEFQQRLERIRQEVPPTLFELSPVVSRPIIHDSLPLGTILVEQDRDVFISRMLVTGSIGMAILLLSILGSYILARWLGQIVTTPVQSLAATMGEISRTRNYGLRADVGGVIELAQLSEGFNKMLGEIAQRDQMLLEQQKHLYHQANYDPLTGLPNRALFNDRLSQALRHAERTNEKLALLFIDLDDFKPVNDTYGHQIGDLLLIECSRRLEQETRAYDTVARLGGDEFIIFLQGVKSTDHAMIVARKHLNNLMAEYLLEDKHLRVSASIGIALFPEHGNTVEQLLKSADTAMYHAKASGKNHFTLFKNSLDQDSPGH